MTHLNLEEDISDLLHLGELIIELGVVRPGELLAHQLIRLQKKIVRKNIRKKLREKVIGKEKLILNIKSNI